LVADCGTTGGALPLGWVGGDFWAAVGAAGWRCWLRSASSALC